MDSTFKVDWQGDKVLGKVRYATRWGIDSTMADCVVTAKSLCPIGQGPKRSGAGLQGSIQMRPAVDTGDQITGYWGSFSTKYARWVEEGTGPHMLGPIYPRTKKALFWPGADHPVRMVSAFLHPGSKPHPYLIPAAQQHYPSLALRIRGQLEWGAK